jgi:hypothetical protein
MARAAVALGISNAQAHVDMNQDQKHIAGHQDASNAVSVA